MNEAKILQILNNSDNYISGEEISKLLNVSRTSVWKSVNSLRSRGCKIVSATNKGYKLESKSDLLFPEEIQKDCKTKIFGKNVNYLKECTSTNDFAKKGDLENDPEGSIYLTDNQTIGRGRMGRKWHFDDSLAIAMSILLKPKISPMHVLPISLLAGLATSKAITKLTGIETSLKWPNDIVVSGKKVSGILIESATMGEIIKYVVVGIGVNCNNNTFPDLLKDIATSVYIETENTISRKELICGILNEFEQLYIQWQKEYNSTVNIDDEKEAVFSYIFEYKAKCINIEQEVRIIQGDKEIFGIAKDISSLGNLIVETSDKKMVKFSSGEISLRTINGYA